MAERIQIEGADRNPLMAGALAAILMVSSGGHAQDAVSKEDRQTTGAPSAALAESRSATTDSPADLQPELFEKLQHRIELLEKGETRRSESADALRQAHEQEVQKFQERIAELGGKVKSLEAGRVLPEIAVAADDSPTPRSLDQKIRIAERRNELAAEAAEARAKESPRLGIGQNGISFSSADSNFVFKIRGLVQLDSRTFFKDNALLEGNDSFVLRRARPIFEGTVFRDFDFQLVPDFGGSSVQLYDAHLNFRLRPELQLRAGKFKAPVGLEQLQSDSALPFNERSLVNDLLPARNVGVQLWGDVAVGTFSYALGVFNGAGDSRNPNNSDFGDTKEFAGRIFLQPFKPTGLTALQGLGFGLGGSYSEVNSNILGLPNTTGGALPGYTTDGQQQFFAYNPVVGLVVADGAHWRLSPQAAWLKGPFGLLGEYLIAHQEVLNDNTQHRAKLEHSAWQVSAQWVLTGEPASFSGITPLHPFDLRAGRWGAWQLVARYGLLNIDDATFSSFANPATSAESATAWSVGINWWLNKNIRVLTSFSHTYFKGGGSSHPLEGSITVPPATVSHQDENVLLTRLQLAF